MLYRVKRTLAPKLNNQPGNKLSLNTLAWTKQYAWGGGGRAYSRVCYSIATGRRMGSNRSIWKDRLSPLRNKPRVLHHLRVKYLLSWVQTSSGEQYATRLVGPGTYTALIELKLGRDHSHSLVASLLSRGDPAAPACWCMPLPLYCPSWQAHDGSVNVVENVGVQTGLLSVPAHLSFGPTMDLTSALWLYSLCELPSSLCWY